MSETTQLLDWLREGHGYHLCLMNQHLRNGNMKKATRSQGMAHAYMQAIVGLEEGALSERDIDPVYVELSEAHFTAEREHQDDTTELRGLE